MTRSPRFAVLLVAACGAGCVATHPPLADGIPVRRLPAEVLGSSRAGLEPVPLTLLRQKEPAEYRFDRGDVIGVVAEDVTVPNTTTFRVRDDGTIVIAPDVPPISVRGKSLAEVKAAVVKAITVDKKLILPGKERVTVDLVAKRVYRVHVIREDSTDPACGGGAKSTGHTLTLDAYHNDLLEALTRTGGLPGPCAKNEVVIRRDDPARPAVRIPLRTPPGEPVAITDADIILKDGDTVLVEARGNELYTVVGGPGCGDHPLPRDADVRIVEALSKAVCPAPACGVATVLRSLGCNRQVPILVDLGDALRDPRENILILPGDVIVLPGCKDCGPKGRLHQFHPRIWLGPGKWKVAGCDTCGN